MNKLLALVLVVSACTFKKKDLSNQTQNGHEGLYALSEKPEAVGRRYKRIVLAATNDVQAHFGPVALNFKDKHHKSKQQIEVGGVDVMSSYLKILRSKYQNVLLVDSGDFLAPNGKRVKSIRKFYQELGYDAMTVGLGDFNLRLPAGSTSSTQFIRDFAKDSSTPLLLSNLYELKTARGVEWKGTKPYLIKEIDGVKIGILGIVPDDIVALTPVDNRVGLYVESMVQNTLRYARLLRSLGAQMVVVLTHQGAECGKKIAEDQKLPLSKVNFEPEKPNVCDMSGALGDYLTRLPPGLVDVVVGGRHHQKMANLQNGVVLLSGFDSGKSMGLVEFTFSKESGKLIPDETVIRQPVMFCREFFKETNDCYTEDPSVDHAPRVPATFLGETITPDSEMREKFKSFFTTKTTARGSRDWKEALKILGADLVYTSETSGKTQLITLELSGRDLADLLEARFNQRLTTGWFPTQIGRAHV